MTRISESERNSVGIDFTEAPFRQPPALAHEDIELSTRDKFHYGPAAIPGYEFDIRHAGENAGRLTVLLDSDLGRLGRQGNIGATIEPRFRGRDFPAKAVEAVIPLMREHGLDAVVITCEPGSAPVERACQLLNASYVDTLEAPNGSTPKRRYVRAL